MKQSAWLVLTSLGALVSGAGCSSHISDVGASGPRAVAVGRFSSCALGSNGVVKCWGFNNAGLLGLGDTTERGDLPGQMGNNLGAVDLGTGRTAKEITVGIPNACAVLDNGTVKCWGYNPSGQLGLGDTINRGDLPGEMGDNLPAVDLGTGRTARAVVGGPATCALLDNGTVKCWGRNQSGELGLGDTTDRGDLPGEMGDNLPAVDLGSGRTAQAIAVGVGGEWTCALLDNGTVKCWGENTNGELGLGDTTSHGDALIGLHRRVVKSRITGARRLSTFLERGPNGLPRLPSVALAANPSRKSANVCPLGEV
jgi:E3 ubiquitin-protein ligase HERC3